MAWNAMATGRDDAPVGGTTGVAAHDKGTAKNEAPMAHEEAGYGVATDVTEWGGVGTTAACNAAAVGQDAAPGGCLTG